MEACRFDEYLYRCNADNEMAEIFEKELKEGSEIIIIAGECVSLQIKTSFSFDCRFIRVPGQ